MLSLCLVGTPASLSCGSMTLGSLEEALPQSPGAVGGGGSADFDTTAREGGPADEEDYEEDGEECYRVGGARAGDTPSLATTSRQDTLSPPTSLASSPQHHYPQVLGPLHHQGMAGVQQMQRGGGTSTYDDPEECTHLRRDEEEEEEEDEDEDATVPAGRPIPVHQQRRLQGQNAEVSPPQSPPPIPPPPLPHTFQTRPFRSTSCQDLVLDEDDDGGLDGYCEDGTPVAVTDLISPNTDGQRIYSSSYPGGTNNGSSSGGESDGGVVGVHMGLGGSLGVGGGSTEDGLSHDDVSHDSYELLERDEDDDDDDDDDEDDRADAEEPRSPRCAVAEPEIFELEGTEDELECDMNILDKVDNGHTPLGRTKSDPLPPPSLPLVIPRRHHHILTHQKSIDLTPTAGSSEAEKEGGEESGSGKEASSRVDWSVAGSDVEIPYILHKRHLCSGQSGSSSGGDQDLPPPPPPPVHVSSVDLPSPHLISPPQVDDEPSLELPNKSEDISPLKDGLSAFTQPPSLTVPPAPAPSPGSSSSSSPPHHLAKPSDVVSLIRLPPAQIFSNKDDTLDDEDITMGTSIPTVTGEESSAIEDKSSGPHPGSNVPPPTAESESTTGESEKGGKPPLPPPILKPRGRAFSSGDADERKKTQPNVSIEQLTSDRRKNPASSSSGDRRRAEMERRFESRRMMLLESSGSSSLEDVPQAPRWSRRGSRGDGNKSPGTPKDTEGGQQPDGGPPRRGRPSLHSSQHHHPHVPPPMAPPLLRPPVGGCCPSFSFPARTLSRISERSTTNSEPDSPGRFTGSPPYSPPSSTRSRSSPPSVSTSSSGEERPEEGEEEEEEGDSLTSELLSSSDRPQPSLCSSPSTSSSSPSSSRSSPSVRSDRRLPPPKEEPGAPPPVEEPWPSPPPSARTEGLPTPSPSTTVATPCESSQTPRSASSSFFFDPASSTPPPPSSSASSFLTSPRTASFFDPSSTASPHRRLSSSSYFFGDLDSPLPPPGATAPSSSHAPPRSPLSPLPPPPVITLMPPPPPRPQPEKRTSGVVVGRVETYYVEEVRAEEACKVVLDPVSGQEVEEIGLDPMRGGPWECGFEAVEEEDELEEFAEEAKEDVGSGGDGSSSSSVDFSAIVMDTGPRGTIEKPKKRRMRRDKDLGIVEGLGDVIMDFGDDGDSPTILPPPPPPPVRYSGYMPKQSSV
ncbi:serine/arginine repetitive matrix protein 1-like [Ischnura elegans]|uniref:serine/arginine repetitive matrix protein 1-like n=1 Tax=Ischnura elegans TaxID=197161 RepID=UPI001ED89EB6|nr:serine/arginine repetitive matrix protein 1-like [Ischnura elegans]